jgi:hypothetical protein
MDVLDMIDDRNLRDEIYANMQLKTTDELMKIWEENDREEWTPLAFDVVKEILFQRTGTLPEIPAFHKDIRKQVENKTFLKRPKNKLLQITGIAYIVMFIMLVIFNPAGENSQNNIVGDICLLGIGICSLIVSVVSTRQAWTMDSKSYMEWYRSQLIFPMPDWLENMGRFTQPLYPDWLSLWSARLISPLFFLFGIIFLLLAVSLIVTLFR